MVAQRKERRKSEARLGIPDEATIKEWRKWAARFQLDPDKIFDYDDTPLRQPPKKRVTWLNRKLRAQLKYAYNHAPAIKNIFDKAGVSLADIRTIKDLEKLPVINKDYMVKAQRANPPFGGFLAVPLTDLSVICVSPGPLYDAWSEKNFYCQLRTSYRYGGTEPGEIAIQSGSVRLTPGAGAGIVDLLLGITSVVSGPGHSELQVQLMREFEATMLSGGFPSFAMRLIKKAEEMGYDFRRDFKVRKFSLGAERHGFLLKKTFEEDYGLQVVAQNYSTADLGIGVANECEEKNAMHFNDEDYLVEICDPKTGKQLGPGEQGEIVVTKFDDAYPLVRFGSGDLASYVDDPCPCGLTAPRIPRILGMVGDHLRVKGMFVHKRELAEVVSKMPEIAKAQMVVTLRDGYRDGVNWRIELSTEGVDPEAFRQKFTKACQDVFKLRPDNIEFVAQGTLLEGYQPLVDKRWS